EDIRILLEKSQIPPDSIYPLEEKIRIIDKAKIKILDENREKSIKDFESTLISNVPEILTIRRVYIDYEYVKRAREVLA
ncbi:phosphohydrolase, partial [Sulfolobus sp. E3]